MLHYIQTDAVLRTVCTKPVNFNGHATDMFGEGQAGCYTWARNKLGAVKKVRTLSNLNKGTTRALAGLRINLSCSLT